MGLGRCLDVKHFVVSGQFEGFFSGDHSFGNHIALVADQDEDDLSVAVVFDVFHPPGHIAEGVFASEVEHDQGGCRGAVVGTSDGFELFLSCGVPYLQFDDFGVDDDVFGCELDSDCVLVVRVEPVLYEAADDAGLSDSCVSHKDELEGVVKVAGLHRLIRELINTIQVR